MDYTIQDTAAAALALFRRGDPEDYAEADRLDRENLETAEAVFHAIMDGAAGEIATACGLIILSRSIRGAWVQISHFAEIAGSLEATSHHDSRNSRDLLDNIPDGITIHLEV